MGRNKNVKEGQEESEWVRGKKRVSGCGARGNGYLGTIEASRCEKDEGSKGEQSEGKVHTCSSALLSVLSRSSLSISKCPKQTDRDPERFANFILPRISKDESNP